MTDTDDPGSDWLPNPEMTPQERGECLKWRLDRGLAIGEGPISERPDFERSDVTGMNLAGKSFRCGRLRGSWLVETDLRNADLSGVVLSN